MANFEMYFSDAKRETAERAKVTPIKCGEPTQEEMEEAFKEIFEKEWRKQHE
jgi:hypothetical protein